MELRDLAMIWAITAAIVMSAIVIGPQFVECPPLQGRIGRPDFVWEQLSAVDGTRYLHIQMEGYGAEGGKSLAVFFPGYPVIGWGWRTLFRSPILSLLVVSNLSCLIAVWFWSQTVTPRTSIGHEQCALDATLWMLVSPMSLFFRVCYSESLFVAFVAALLYGMKRRWSLGLLALLAGAATGTRPVGVMLLPVFVWHVWETADARRDLLRGLCWTPIAVWGLLAYMLFLGLTCGDPWLFAHNQSVWVFKALSWRQKFVELVTFEPIWGCYLPSSRHYWQGLREHTTVWNSLDFWNPLYFVASGGLLVLGARRGWLCRREQLLGWLLLLFPYVMIGAENSMQSQARFTVVNLPLYLVLANVTVRQPTWLRLIVFGCVGGTLIWTAMLFGSFASIF